MADLVKMFFFFIAVLSELDELKKTSEGVRNAIKWLECEFKKGNRFLRSQRNNETMPLPLIKIKKKLGESSHKNLGQAEQSFIISFNFQIVKLHRSIKSLNFAITLSPTMPIVMPHQQHLPTLSPC
jgi:hypothetical protein